MCLKGGNLSRIWPRTVDQERVRDVPSAPQLLLQAAGPVLLPLLRLRAPLPTLLSLIPTWSSATSQLVVQHHKIKIYQTAIS